MSDSAGVDCLDVFAASTGQGDVTRRAVEEANAKAVFETGNGIADGCRRHVQIEAAARKLPSLAMATTASSSINPLLYIVTNSLDTPSQFISIIATTKAPYVAAIPNDVRRLECPKPLSLTSFSAP